MRRGNASHIFISCLFLVFSGTSPLFAFNGLDRKYVAWSSGTLFDKLSEERRLQIEFDAFEEIDRVLKEKSIIESASLPGEVIRKTKVRLFTSLVTLFPDEWFTPEEIESGIATAKEARTLIGSAILFLVSPFPLSSSTLATQIGDSVYDSRHFDFNKAFLVEPKRQRQFVVTSDIQDLGEKFPDWIGSPLVELRFAVARHVFGNRMTDFIEEALQTYIDYERADYRIKHQLDHASISDKAIINGYPLAMLGMDLGMCFVGGARLGKGVKGSGSRVATVEREPLISDGFRVLKNKKWIEMPKPDPRFPLNHESFPPETPLGIVQVKENLYCYPKGNRQQRRSLQATGTHEDWVTDIMHAMGVKGSHNDLATYNGGKGDAKILAAIAQPKNWSEMTPVEKAEIQRHRDLQFHHHPTMPEDAKRLSLTIPELKDLALQKQADRLAALQDPKRPNRDPLPLNAALSKAKEIASSPFEKTTATLLEVLHTGSDPRLAPAMHLDWKAGTMPEEVVRLLESGKTSQAIYHWYEAKLARVLEQMKFLDKRAARTIQNEFQKGNLPADLMNTLVTTESNVGLSAWRTWDLLNMGPALVEVTAKLTPQQQVDFVAAWHANRMPGAVIENMRNGHIVAAYNAWIEFRYGKTGGEGNHAVSN